MLKHDASNKGWVLGWVVYKPEPWDFRGVFGEKADADLISSILGGGYRVEYGSHRVGSDDAVFSNVQP